METWIIIYIIFAILICVFAMVYVAKEFVYDAIERRRERRRERAAAENAEDSADKTFSADYAIVPKGMMLVPVDYAIKSEVSATQTDAPKNELPAHETDENALVISRAETMTIDEAYAKLSREQKKYFDGLLSYALSKENAAKYPSKTEISVRAIRKPIIRIFVRKGVTVAAFRLENDLMKEFRKNGAETKITVRDTKINIVDNAAYETAKGLIDVAEENNKREREAAEEARKKRLAERRKARG